MTTVLINLFWTVAGLAVGYYLGRAGRLAIESETAMLEEERPRNWRTRVFGTQVFGAFLIILAMLSVILGAVFISGQQSYIDRQAAVVECQNDYNRQFAEALAERNEAAAREREGQRQLLRAAIAERDPAALQAAYEQYLALLEQADARRNANPLPVRAC